MKCASWGKWRSDTVIRSFGHIVRKICPRKTCPLRTGKGVLSNVHAVRIDSFSLAQFPKALWGSSPSADGGSFQNRLWYYVQYFWLTLVFIHHSEVSADCRFSTIFLYPKQYRQQVGFGCSYSTAQKASILRSQPHRSSVLEFFLPTHVPLLHVPAFQLRSRSTWAMPNMK